MVSDMSNRYAIIKNNLVVNVALADENYAAALGWVPCPHAGPGWAYIDGQFIEPVIELKPQPEAPTLEQLLAQVQTLQSQILALTGQNGS